ncbi:hypothetical protein QYC20_17270 (plasmid) [Lactiplantibacillus pentosus]|uniref:hypothetical protein n=1 Tax=Lactiplantibacillus pentosus TaxID=1589 RepID=UPI002659E8DC|nr:hypothetical protein [Lactiplantibacillus pentosus]WKF77684.1 hypothetical protein QYC20_17270 [Lactiplantibacillus pentosus]
MATPNVGILTTTGKALIDKVNSGQAKISFSKVVFSSMDNSQLSDTQIKALTAIAPQEVVVSSPQTTLDTNSGETRIRATGTNEKLTDGVYVKTYGVFAKDDTGSEILYGVTVSPNPNYFPAYDGVTPQAVTYSYKTVIQETSNITMTNSNDVYVSQEDLTEAIAKIPQPDLSGYDKTDDVDKKLQNKQDKLGYTAANDSTVVHTADMRKPASDVAGIDEVSKLQTQVDNSTVGTNLLINTETETGDMWLTPGNNLSAEKLNGCNVETQIGDWKSARYLFDDLKKRNVINTTDDFIFSAMLRVDPTLKDNPATINFFSTATDKDNTIVGYIKDYADGYWHRVSTVFKFLTTQTADTAFNQSIRFELGNSNGATVYWTQRKLEKGSVATDWCPNPSEILTKADDSKVAHLSGANNFDTVPTVNNNPLLLVSSLPSDLARTSQQTNFTAGLQSGGVNVATAADLKSVEASAWRELNFDVSQDNYKAFSAAKIVYKINRDEKYISFFFAGTPVGKASSKPTQVTDTPSLVMDLSSVLTEISNINFRTEYGQISDNVSNAASLGYAGAKVVFTSQVYISPYLAGVTFLPKDYPDCRIYYTSLVNGI